MKYGKNSVKYGKEREIFYQISHCFAVFDAVLRYLTPYRPPKSSILEENALFILLIGVPAATALSYMLNYFGLCVKIALQL